jgi:mRNA interferase HigB
MRIYSKSALVAFHQTHPEAKERLDAWFRACETCDAANYNELKQTFQTADYVPKKFTIFDVGGNKFRIVTVIHYNTKSVYIRAVFTHAEYDKWTKQNRGK